LAAAGLGLIVLPDSGVAAGIAGSFAVLLGLTLGTGEALVVLGPALEAVLARAGGLPGRLAAGFIRRSLGRTAVATAAFTVALAMSIGLGTLIGSFRRSLDEWMAAQITADLYIGRAAEGAIPESFVDGLRGLPGVAALDCYRYVPMLFRGQPAHIQAVDAAVLQRFAHYRWLGGGGEEHWDEVRRGAVAVSESFARRFGVRAGGRIELAGREGPRAFAVAGVFHDYTSEHGVVLMDRAVYFELAGDRTVNTVGVFLGPGPAGDAAVQEVERRAAAEGYPVQRRAQLHRAIRAVFDATFAVTRSLRLLAVVTAFFGVAGALLTLFTERRREFGIFRALGFSSGQAVGVTFLEGIGLGAASFALSAVVGTVVAALLIRVINLRSFHWTVFFHPAWESYALAAAVAVGASLGAAAYPAWLVHRTYPQIQLREE
ncbi:MAG TPA: ABC transporter permease, partial [bacterium]